MDLDAAFEFSRYAARLRAARPELANRVIAALDEPTAIDANELAPVVEAGDTAGLGVALRQIRARVSLAALLRDLTGRASLSEVCAAHTRLAEMAIGAAVEVHHRLLVAEHGEPVGAESGESQRLIVVAMGKLGGAELNVSSDIDLVFVYPEDGATTGRKPVANQEFFDRLGRRVASSLADVTADGFVFRVDLRLRPYGESGPPSTSFAALENYLVSQGRTWERYAWLKARPLTEDRRDELERLITPFVFRKYLDYDAYGGLRDVHRQIREQGRRKDYARNIKLGPGGIREIEFITQALQLVRAGREPALRIRGTLPALRLLGERGVLPRPAVAELAEAYTFLRNLEHRLQYRDDLQTHDLPTDGDEEKALAQACGERDVAHWRTALASQRRLVDRHFDLVFRGDAGLDDDPLAAVWLDPAPEEAQYAALASVGYATPSAVIGALARVRGSARYLQLPTRSRQRFDALVPQLLRAAAANGRAADAKIVFDRLLTLLETISGRSVYLALLAEHPPVLPRLAQLVGASAWAADYLTRHPILLDELLDSRVLLEEPDWIAWRRELDAQMAEHRGDAERQMDALRHFQHAQSFRLLAQDLNARLTVERLADHLSALADAVLAATLAGCWTQMHVGKGAAAPAFAIIGYGKLGGKELGYASDLDLVFLYEETDEGAQERYTRLAHRLNTWLTAITPAGRLYETDLRLRPDGAKGLISTSLDAFRRYQRHDAWTWEHQALTRARFVTGDASLGAAFEAERESILRMQRDPQMLAKDVVDMRRRMHAGHPNRTPLFDLKHDPGGMVDVEFIVQYLVLLHSREQPSLTGNVGNIALLARAGALGLVPRELATTVADAYRAYRRLQHEVRLQGAGSARVDPTPHRAARSAVDELWGRVFGASWQ
jgi:[glutamine synthetase] adenylyltransferase / [glutamine synthetase]-adenylyl-L-tyrosine phosphorylase